MILPAILRFVLAHAAATLGGALAMAAGLPLPWMIGALVAVGGLSLAGFGIPPGPRLRNAAMIVLLTGVGLTFTPDAARLMFDHVHIIVLGSLLTLIISAAAIPLMVHLGPVTRRTAYFACIPGGPAEMGLLGERHGGVPSQITFSQLLRIVTLVITLPSVMALFGWSGDVVPDTRAVGAGAAPFGLGIVLAAAVLMALALHRLRFAAAFVVGPLVVGCGAAMTGATVSSLPPWLMAGAQVLAGTYLGTQFSRRRIDALRGFLPAALVTVVLLTFLCALLGMGLHLVSDEDFMTMILASAPGSVTEMALTAEALHLNTPLVIAYHVTRILIVMLLTPPLFLLVEHLGLLGPMPADENLGAAAE